MPISPAFTVTASTAEWLTRYSCTSTEINHVWRDYSTGDALKAILNYWVEELRMNYVALAIALG